MDLLFVLTFLSRYVQKFLVVRRRQTGRERRKISAREPVVLTAEEQMYAIEQIALLDNHFLRVLHFASEGKSYSEIDVCMNKAKPDASSSFHELNKRLALPIVNGRTPECRHLRRRILLIAYNEYLKEKSDS